MVSSAAGARIVKCGPREAVKRASSQGFCWRRLVTERIRHPPRLLTALIVRRLSKLPLMPAIP